MPYSFKPDISVKFSPRITKTTKRLIDRVCRRHQMFEADVLRFCLEAIAPIAAKRGMAWLTRQSPSRTGELSCMVTVRTSKRVKGNINTLTGRGKYTEVEVLRYLYDAILPIAYKDGFAKIMAMREKNL
jgi:hypothetical protein